MKGKYGVIAAFVRTDLVRLLFSWANVSGLILYDTGSVGGAYDLILGP